MKTLRKQAAPVFKAYVMGQVKLIPASYEEMISADHLVRKVNEAIDHLDMDVLINEYQGGGTSSYHPKMMLKVLVYAYADRTYGSRRIAKALRENINYMWLSGENRPDFRTINNFRNSRMKEVVREVFKMVVKYLHEKGYVKLEDCYLDGTILAANANKYQVVWAKRTESYKKKLNQKLDELLDQIEAENQAEEAEYGDKDLEELGGNGEDRNSEELKKRVEELNQRLKKKAVSKVTEHALHKIKKEYLPQLEKYEQQEKILQGRKSYAKSDPDATSMRMKEDQHVDKAWPKPAYNVQIGTENQFITGFSIHQNAGDASCLVGYFEGLKASGGQFPHRVIADAGYGSEENYGYLEANQTEAYVKYNTFYQDTHVSKKPDPKQQFRSTHFPYDKGKDEFLCPANKPMHFVEEKPQITDNGFQTSRRVYECEDCTGCPLKEQCTKAKGNRQIEVSQKLMAYREQARDRLISPEGVKLRKLRSVEVESVFGQIKQNMGFRRFSLRGKEKVETEWGLVSIAHNMRKLAAQ
jgi:transposase